MKKFNIIIIFAALTILLAAGGNDDAANETTDPNAEDTEVTEETVDLAYEPDAIDPDTDVCEVCAMAVADDQYATQIVLENDRSLKFDDLGCLYGWIEENGKDDIGAAFVRDFHSEEWILLEDATYVFDEEIETPMAYGIISFENAEDAESYMEEHGLGELLTAEDLDDHKWEMMKHDHDHGDEEEDDHGNHDDQE